MLIDREQDKKELSFSFSLAGNFVFIYAIAIGAVIKGTNFSVPSHLIPPKFMPIQSHPMGFPLEYNSIKIIKFMKI